MAWTCKSGCKGVDEDGKLLILWLTHGTSLVRCSPHQVRPLVEEQGCTTPADPEAALKDLQELRARSTTQFKDLADADPSLEDMAEADDPNEYEPSLLDDRELAEREGDENAAAWHCEQPALKWRC